MARTIIARMIPRFPSSVTGTGGIKVEKVNGGYRISTDFQQFSNVAGALLVGQGDETWAALNPGIAGQVLTVVQGGIAYQTPARNFVWTDPLTASSTTSLNFENIPSGITQVAMVWSTLSSNGISDYSVRVGTSAGYISTGYLQAGIKIDNTGNIRQAESTGFVMQAAAASSTMHVYGVLTRSNPTSQIWTGEFGGMRDNISVAYFSSAGTITLPGDLDRVQVTTTGGTDLFTSGTVRIGYA